MMSNPNTRQQIQNLMGSRGMGGGGVGGGAMPNFGGMGGAPTNTANATNNNNNAAPQGNDQDQTEEDMIAEAIRRSLEER